MDDEPVEGTRVFTERELRAYDGENGPMLIAYRGVVYDVTGCPRWRTGIHEQMHFPGLDLTGEIEGAPHAEEVLLRPCVRPVGRLSSGDHR